MRTLSLLSVLFIAACGQQFEIPKDPQPNPGIGPEFKVFVSQFETDYGRSIGNFSIVFGEQAGNIIGVCKIWSDGRRLIEIDPTYWNNMNVSDSYRKILIYHELGHCVLDRGHTSEKINTRYGLIPKSIMYPYSEYYFTVDVLQSYYIDELFSKPTVVPLSEHNNDCVQYMD